MHNDLQINVGKLNDKTGLIFKIVESLNKILREDQAQKQPLFLSINEQFLLKLVTGIVKNPQKSYVIGITVNLHQVKRHSLITLQRRS